jgi:hypothetical protein
MNKTLAGLIIAVGAFIVTAPSHAATSGYGGIAEPIPTAVPLHAASTESQGPVDPHVLAIQYYGHHYDRYHHWHRPVYYRREHHYYRHHGVRIGPVIIR